MTIYTRRGDRQDLARRRRPRQQGRGARRGVRHGRRGQQRHRPSRAAVTDATPRRRARLRPAAPLQLLELARHAAEHATADDAPHRRRRRALLEPRSTVPERAGDLDHSCSRRAASPPTRLQVARTVMRRAERASSRSPRSPSTRRCALREPLRDLLYAAARYAATLEGPRATSGTRTAPAPTSDYPAARYGGRLHP